MLVSLECVEHIRWQLCTPLQLNVHTHACTHAHAHTHTHCKKTLAQSLTTYRDIWYDMLTTLQWDQNVIFYMISLDMPLFELSNYGLFVRATSQQHSRGGSEAHVHARWDTTHPTQDG